MVPREHSLILSISKIGSRESGREIFINEESGATGSSPVPCTQAAACLTAAFFNVIQSVTLFFKALCMLVKQQRLAF